MGNLSDNIREKKQSELEEETTTGRPWRVCGAVASGRLGVGWGATVKNEKKHERPEERAC